MRSSRSTDAISRPILPQAAALGRLEAALEPGFHGRIDRRAIRVELFDAQVVSVSTVQLLNGANVCAIRSASGAWEVLQFEAAEELSPQIWKLSGLLRGQLGTNDAMAAGAPVGADFVMLDDAVISAGLLESEIGLLLNWRVGPSGSDFSAASFATSTEIGGTRALLPLSPVHLKAAWIGNDLKLSWIRRSRIDADTWNAHEIPLGEQYEEYQVEIAPAGGAVVRTQIVSDPVWLYEASDLLADFGTVPAEVDVTVRQLSVAVGWGIPITSRLSLA